MTLTELLSEIAEAIQSVKGDNTPIKAENFATEIKNLKLNNSNSNSGLINSTADMQTLIIEIVIGGSDYSDYSDSGSGSAYYAEYAGFDNPNSSGEINGVKFEDIYTKFKNGQLLIKLKDQTGTRLFDVVDVMYDKLISHNVPTQINSNTYRNDTTSSEALVLSTSPFNYYDIDLYEYIDGDDPGYVTIQNTNIQGLTLGFVHGEIIEYGEEIKTSGSESSGSSGLIPKPPVPILPE